VLGSIDLFRFVSQSSPQRERGGVPVHDADWHDGWFCHVESGQYLSREIRLEREDAAPQARNEVEDARRAVAAPASSLEA
jgi:hypothetical protein